MLLRSQTTLIALVLAIDAWQSSPWQQSVNLKGTLWCSSAPVPNATVILTHIAALAKDDSKRRVPGRDPSGHYGVTTTDEDGVFSFSVILYNMLPISPALQVRHTCGVRENCTSVAKFIVFPQCVQRGYVTVVSPACQRITADLTEAPNLDDSDPRCA